MADDKMSKLAGDRTQTIIISKSLSYHPLLWSYSVSVPLVEYHPLGLQFVTYTPNLEAQPDADWSTVVTWLIPSNHSWLIAILDKQSKPSDFQYTPVWPYSHSIQYQNALRAPTSCKILMFVCFLQVTRKGHDLSIAQFYSLLMKLQQWILLCGVTPRQCYESI